MSLKKTIMAMALATAFVTPLSAQNSPTEQMTAAVLKVYGEELSENPQNYNVYFRRAHLYYGLNQYLRALSDIDNALKYTPAGDKDLLAQEYALRSNIYLMTDRPEEALADISQAYELDRTSYAYLYQKANLELQLDRFAEAKSSYNRLRQLKSRSLEALIGMARVAVKENNLGLANEYLDQAIAMYPTDADAYLRRASVLSLMGNNNGAVDDILVALSLDNHSGRPFNELLKMSNTDYKAVITGLSNAISKAPDTAIFIYIRAVIAQTHFHYNTAIADYNTLLDRRLYNSPTIHAGLAESYFALSRYDEALREINIAIGTTPDNANYLVTLSKIRLAMGDDNVALREAQSALISHPDDSQALEQQGLCEFALTNYDAASNLFGQAILNDADHAYPYIVRGWILKDYLGKAADATTFFARAADLYPADAESYDIRSLHPFALLALGHNEDAYQWTKKALETKDVDGYNHYLGACLYANAGYIDEAFDALRTSLSLGFADLQNIRFNNIANINLAPLRDDPRFDELLNRYNHLFE